MAEGRLAPAAQPAEEQYISAPLSGADFLSEEPVRTLFVVPSPEQTEGTASQMESVGSRQKIRGIKLNRGWGTMVLGLDKSVVSRILKDSQLEDLSGLGFRPTPNPHITVLNFNNGRNIIRALGGNNGKLTAVKQEAKEVDWTWRSTGVLVPFQGRRVGRVKIVNIIDCPGIEEFNQSMERNIPGLVLERHPPHVTIMRGPNELKDRSLIVGGVAIGRPLSTLDHLRN